MMIIGWFTKIEKWNKINQERNQQFSLFVVFIWIKIKRISYVKVACL